jgi:uncharacterized protein with FMN-binding domain
MALGSAAVLAVYAAGYLRTKPAADQLEAQSSMRSMRRPFPPTAGAQGAPERPATAPSLDAVVRTAADDSTAAAVIAAAARAAGQPAPPAMKAVPGSSTGSLTAPTNPASGTASMPAVVRDSTRHVTPAAPALSGAPAAISVATQSAPQPANVPASVAAPTVALPSIAVQPIASQPVASQPTASQLVAPAATAPAAAPAPVAAAPASAPAAAPAAKTAAKATYRDGFHYGRGTSRHGDIESMIEISNGRIISVVISQCLTQYSCRWIAALPGQVVARQSADVDYVTGATESANAFYFSIVQALMQAK